MRHMACLDRCAARKIDAWHSSRHASDRCGQALGRSPGARVASAVLIVALGVGQMSAAAHANEAELLKRVEQLEDKIVDMEVTIGTLQSLAQPGGPSAAPVASTGYGGSAGGGGGADAARVSALETQIRALTAQVERMGGQQGNAAGALVPNAYGQANESYNFNNSSEFSGGASAPSPQGFGSTTVTQGGGANINDPIGGLLSGNGAVPDTGQRYSELPPAQTTLQPATGNSKALYETAYGYLLQQDYGAAEVAFSDFLQRFPQDELAGNAQYWLGETHYVRGEYKDAAGAFLQGYQTYAGSSKAPDSLLKLAMSLERLGQRDAACSSYGQLISGMPDAKAHIKNRAASERRRIGC